MSDPTTGALTRRLGGANPGDLYVVLSDDGWRLVWRQREASQELVALDPGTLAARLLNRDLREASGAPRPEGKEETARRMAEVDQLLSRLRGDASPRR